MNNEEPILLPVGKDTTFKFQRSHDDLALFVSLGAALAVIQSFEFSLATHLGLLSKLDPAEFWSKTLGQLIKGLQKQLPDDSLADRLEYVRNIRNYIVHGALRSYGWPFMSDTDYIRAIREFEDIRLLIEEVNREINRYLSDRSLLQLFIVLLDVETGEVKLDA
ncbi:MAG: hypothetical protein V1874_03645 [Spirochaetota bacterium]